MKKNYFLNSQKLALREIHKIPYENPFFPRQAIQNTLFAVHSRYTGDTQYRVWFDLDNSLSRWKKLFFKFSKTRTSRKSQNSVWKPNFFPRQAIPSTLFDVHCHYTDGTQYRVWFYLDNSLTRWKRSFLNFLFREIQKVPYEILNFFRKRYTKNFFCFTLSLHWWYCTSSLVWVGQLLVPMKKNYFLNSQKFALREIRKTPYENPIFFPRQAIPNTLFDVHCHYAGGTQYRVWFYLDNSLTRWKRPIFKIPFSLNSKSSKRKPNFFPRQAKPKILFALHCHYTGDTQYRVWFDLDNSLTRWKRSFFKFPFSRNSKSAVWNTKFFSGKSILIFLIYTLITLVILHTEFGLIWTTPCPDEKELFFKFSKTRTSRNSQNSVWKPIFS